MDEQHGVGGSSEHVHYGATTLPLMRTSCLPEHTLQAACSFRVTHSAEGIDQPRVQRLHTHTHTLSDTVSPHVCQIMLLISLQQILKKQQITSQAHLLHRVLTHCVLKNFNNPNPNHT